MSAATAGHRSEEVLERLHREDHYAAARALEVGGRCAGPGGLRSPVLAVVNPPGRVAPPASVADGLAAMPPGVPRRVLKNAGERGRALQHLGPLVGARAHKRLWPGILDWVSAWPRRAPGRRPTGPPGLTEAEELRAGRLEPTTAPPAPMRAAPTHGEQGGGSRLPSAAAPLARTGPWAVRADDACSGQRLRARGLAGSGRGAP